MCGYFCFKIINFMSEGKGMIDVENLFLPNNFKDNDKKILNYFVK